MDIDLPPKEWTSERKKPREPIFGSDLPGALAYAVGWLVTFAAIHWMHH